MLTKLDCNARHTLARQAVHRYTPPEPALDISLALSELLLRSSWLAAAVLTNKPTCQQPAALAWQPDRWTASSKAA